MDPLRVPPAHKQFDDQFLEFAKNKYPSDEQISNISKVILDPRNAQVLSQCNKETLKAVRSRLIELKAPNCDTVINRITVMATEWGGLPRELQKHIVGMVDRTKTTGKIAKLTEKTPKAYEHAIMLREAWYSSATSKAMLMKNIKAAGEELRELNLETIINAKTKEEEYIDDEDMALIAKWCPNLETLNLGITKITDKGLALFPELKHLKCGITKIKNESLKDLPRGLLTLDISKIGSEPKFIPDLPSKLTKLRANFWSDASNTKDDKGVSYYDHFPQTLKILDLGSSDHFTEKDFVHLPRGLIELDCMFVRNLKGQFKGMPEMLEKFRAIGLTELNDGSIKSLPRHLKSLELGPCRDLTEACIEDFPSTLTDITLTFAFANLPPNEREAARAKLKAKFPDIIFED